MKGHSEENSAQDEREDFSIVRKSSEVMRNKFIQCIVGLKNSCLRDDAFVGSKSDYQHMLVKNVSKIGNIRKNTASLRYDMNQCQN